MLSPTPTARSSSPPAQAWAPKCRASPRPRITSTPTTRTPAQGSEITAEAVAGRGVAGPVVRLPQVHNTEKQGLVTPVIAISREKGVSAYVGDGLTAGPRFTSSTRPVYRLALEKGPNRAR